MNSTPSADREQLKLLLSGRDPRFWNELSAATCAATTFAQLVSLSTLRKKAQQAAVPRPDEPRHIKLAIIGGCTLYPFSDLLQHTLHAAGLEAEIWLGDFDNYMWEITDTSSGLHKFKPEFVLFVPMAERYQYQGKLSDPEDLVAQSIQSKCAELVTLCKQLHEQTNAEIVLTNFVLPAHFDPGILRTKTMASEWLSLKQLNTELGLAAPAFVHLCDLEFLAYKFGADFAANAKGWFESKQPWSGDFSCAVAHEVAHIIRSATAPNKKVLVVDLDETLWGGVIGDDGLEGIELGPLSPRGESFQAFQRAVLKLRQRGILLAVCSKNNPEIAMEVFEKHPEMVLRKEHFASIKANWEPKSNNIMLIAEELNLGLDSFVFVDDNPAEIELVKRFAPAVTTILLGPDAADYVSQLLDARLFEPLQITAEDENRGELYRQEQDRKALMATAVDMDSYLRSLKMTAVISEFKVADLPRIAQLVNKSNQFNVTTRRRTEAELAALMPSKTVAFTLRLFDCFGDQGIVSVMIAQPEGDSLIVDTWLMSCRVLKRGVEQMMLNKLVQSASDLGLKKVIGNYLPTEKNGLVENLYPDMGFSMIEKTALQTSYELVISRFKAFETTISPQGMAYESR